VRRLLALVLGAALLAGCGTEFVHDPPREPRPTSEPDAELDGPIVVDPTAIGIPKLGAWSTLIPLGLTDDCDYSEPPCLAPPPLDQPMQAGWYAGADPRVSGDEYQPGENGPAVIAGHVDGYGPDGSKGHPGIFAKLGDLAPGDKVIIERNDPRIPQPPLIFVVDGVGSFPKDKFPTEDVYGPTAGPTLRLITCGGTFDRGRGHYVDNIVVWASLES
jgi:sortase family protein